MIQDEETRRREAAGAAADEDGFARLITAMRDTSWRVRKAAAARIAEAFPAEKVVTRLVPLLADPLDAGARAAASDALYALGARAVPALASAFSAGDARMRRAVLEVVGTASLVSAADLARTGIRDADANVRVAAIEALGRLRAEGAGSLLTSALADPELLVRYAALETIPVAGDASVDVGAVIRAASDPLQERAAIRALGRLAATEALPLLGDILATRAGSAAWTEALLAAVAIAERKPGETSALSRAPMAALRERLAGNDSRAAAAAAIALARLPAPETAPEIAALAARIPDAAGAARAALMLLGTSGAVAIASAAITPPALAAAAQAWALLPPEPLEQRASMAAALESLAERADSGPARLALATALARRGHVAALPPLVERLLAEPGSDAGRAAAEALSELAAGGGEAAAALVARLGDLGRESPDARAAVAAVAAAAGERASALLTRLARDPVPAVRRAALAALPFATADLAADEARAALSDEDPSVRTAALAALAAVHAEASTVARALDDRDLLVRVAAARALGVLGGELALQSLLKIPIGASPLLDLAIIEAIRPLAAEPRVRERLLAYAATNNPDVSALAHEALVQ